MYVSGLGSALVYSSSSSKSLSCLTIFGVSSVIGPWWMDDPCMDPVGLYHYEGSISLVSFPQPSRQREHGSSYASNSTRPLDSLSGPWPAMGIG